MIFSKIVIPSAFDIRHSSFRKASPHEAAKMLEFRRRAQPFAHETDHFLAKRVAGARPGFRAAKMFHAGLEITKQQTVRARVHERADPFLQPVEKRQFVTSP